MNKFIKIFTLLLGATITMTSCEELNIKPDTDVQSTLDHTFVQAEMNIISTQFDLAAKAMNNLQDPGSEESPFCECAKINVERIGDSQFRMTIDYGEGCECIDERTRKGALTGVFSDMWDKEGVNLVITSDNYQVTNLLGKNFAFDFEKTITRKEIASEKPELHIQVSSAELTSEDDKTITWKSERILTLVEGGEDVDPSNDVYQITGTAEGIARNESAFSVEITEPLTMDASCTTGITVGIVTLTPEGKKARTIDYGDGSCDSEATVSIGDFSTTISLW